MTREESKTKIDEYANDKDLYASHLDSVDVCNFIWQLMEQHAQDTAKQLPQDMQEAVRRTTVGDIAKAAGIHENTVRRYADRGYIESRRDFLGRRIFLRPIETVKRIQGLLNGDIQLTGH